MLTFIDLFLLIYFYCFDSYINFYSRWNYQKAISGGIEVNYITKIRLTCEGKFAEDPPKIS